MKTDAEVACEAVHVAQKERADAWEKGVDLGDLGSHVGEVYARLIDERTAATLVGLQPRVAEAVREIGESIAALSSALERLASAVTEGVGENPETGESPADQVLTASKAVEVDAMALGFMFGRRGRARP